MRSIAVALVAALLLAAPSAAATRAPSPSCGLVTEPVCWTEHFACHMLLNETHRCHSALQDHAQCVNKGVVVQLTLLGTNHYCEGSECTNHGVILLVGESRSCYGNGNLFLVCVGQECAWIILDPSSGMA